MGRLQYLREAEASAMNQTVTCEVLRLVTDKTLSENVNTLLNAAKGEYIKILPDDDLLVPDAIESLEKKIEEGYDFVHSNAINFWKDGKTKYHKSRHISTLAELYRKNIIHGGTVLYRKEALLAVGGMDETLWTGEELDLHYRLLSKGYKLGFLDKVVFKYRRHSDQKSTKGTNIRHMAHRKQAILDIKRRYR